MRRVVRRLVVTPALVALALPLLGLANPGDAGATVAPTLSVSPSSGPVGSVVSVRFSAPRGDGCGGVEFQTSAPTPRGLFIPSVQVPEGAGVGGARFVIPSKLGDPPQLHYLPVTTGRYLFSIVCDTSNMAADAITVTVPFTVTSASLPPSRFVGMAATPDGGGYWLAQRGGGVFTYGDAHFYGSLPACPGGLGITPAAPISGIAATPDGKGYWLVGQDGGVFAFGDAHFYGSLPGLGIEPNGPIVGITATPDGKGYWLVGKDGGIFTFGDATFYGSAAYPSMGCTLAPAVGLSAASTGQVYWVAGQTGGSCGFGNTIDGFTSFGGPGVPFVGALTGIVTTPDGGGAWYVASDGGVFSVTVFGGAAPRFFGSLPGLGVVPAAPIVGMAATPGDQGYWLVGADGGVFAFGDAKFYGSAGASGLPWKY